MSGRLSRRNALNFLRDAIEGNRILWLTREGDRWHLDLDKLTEAFPNFLAGDDWAQGIHPVNPDISTEEPLPGAYVTIVDFTVTKEASYRTSEALSRERSMNKGIIFIGHGRSSAWRDLKDLLTERLDLKHVEFNSSSPASVPTVNRLEEMLGEAEFAFLVLTAEDLHGDGTHHARENVIHEAGLFQG